MDRYIFDKRVVKKTLIKYGIIFACCVPLLLVLDYFMRHINFWAVVVIDATIVLFIILIIYLIEQAIKKKKQNKSNNKDVVVIKKKK